MPTKWGTRRSPAEVLQPSSGRPGAPSGRPTVCAPTMPRKLLSCSAVGPVMRNASAMPMSAMTNPARIASERAGSPSGALKSSSRDKARDPNDND